MILYAVQVVLLFLLCDHCFLVLLVSYDLFLFFLLYHGLMFPYRVSNVAVVFCGMLFRVLLLALANTYRALGIVIVLSYVVSWSASCIG